MKIIRLASYVCVVDLFLPFDNSGASPDVGISIGSGTTADGAVGCLIQILRVVVCPVVYV